ncbi:hypothetical protein [Streptomyces sp. YGL11-2]|uniref:hypothetical protein n=1 Tax=Streptomyces sp. YGL11-2 TaxID=3414028 RepID=UPI003CFA182C
MDDFGNPLGPSLIVLVPVPESVAPLILRALGRASQRFLSREPRSAVGEPRVGRERCDPDVI